MTRTMLLLAALAGCQTVDANPSKDVSVELSSVTLGDDCGNPPPPPPATKKPAPPREAPASQTPQAPCPVGATNCGRAPRHCDQTSMQLSIKAPAGTKPTTIKIKKVELLDTKGKVLEVLTARSPAKWDANNAYVAWNEQVGASETLQAMYELNSPDWNKLTSGRWSAHSKTFQLRVTVTVGTANKTIEKQSITPARLNPPVPT
jgi:hypothetical protein